MKKKFIIFFIVLIFLIKFTLAWSYDESYSCGSAHAYAKISGTYPKCEGRKVGSYCVGRWYTEISHEGDKLYIKERASSWPTANRYGISGVKEISDGKYYLTDGPGEEAPKFIICAWDFDERGGNWAWAYVCAGYLGNENFYLKSVECLENKDCSSDEYCEKTSEDWKNWVCQYKECEIGDEKCEYKTYYVCKDYKWESKSLVIGKCGVECFVNTDCGIEKPVGDPYCSSINEVSRKYIKYLCVSNKCTETEIEKIIEKCDEICENGTCTEIKTYEIINEECVKKIGGRYSSKEECEKYLNNPLLKIMRKTTSFAKNSYNWIKENILIIFKKIKSLLF